jgi:hypothetical protein
MKMSVHRQQQSMTAVLRYSIAGVPEEGEMKQQGF